MSDVLGGVLGGFRLLATSTTFYVTTPLLLLVAAVPAALRSYQLFSGNDAGWLELTVETMRVVLVVCIVTVGRTWLGLSATAWADVWADVSLAYRTRWVTILVELTVVTLVVLAFNTVVEHLVDRASWGAVDARPAADAVIFAVRNVVAIPIYIAAMLIASDVIDG